MSPRYNGPRTPSMQRREKAPQRTPTPGYFLGRCVAVTSLHPDPARQQRQQRCLQSWVDIGLQVIAVNTAEEIADFKFEISNLTFLICDSLTTDYDRQTQRVSTLIAAGRLTGLPFLLLNSDIEICGDPSVIESALQSPDKLTIGIRYNHDARQTRERSKREPWGLDCFLMTAEMAATVPDLPFGIGKPVWDYWLPHHFRALGYAFHWIQQPFFYHATHPLGWSAAEWLIGAKVLQTHYGIELMSGCRDYRNGLEHCTLGGKVWDA